PFRPVPYALGGYLAFTLLRLILAYRIRLPDWFLFLSIVIDMTLLFVLIWSFHIQYGQPASFYLKVPTLLYVFIFIALRALRFDARFVIAAGATAVLGWCILVFYATAVDMQDDMITRDFVYYMTSNAVLIGAEFDKILTILTVTAILGFALIRGRQLLVRSVSEGVAAQELSRFFSPEVAARIKGADRAIRAGMGEIHPAAVLNLDLRGFTRLVGRRDSGEVMALLGAYQALAVPIVQKHGGSIDKFLGDGIMATFGGPGSSQSYAADALPALRELLDAGRAWQDERAAAGKPAPAVNGAIATGEILFGAVGDETRLEYTVIGDAVNLSAKLEKHNKELSSGGVVTAESYDLALAQGYRPSGDERRIAGASIAGVA
ncbi:MAG: adenylate/guanylate cyclase domain-containing protein, partial [Rhodovibrionaceae bacterium]